MKHNMEDRQAFTKHANKFLKYLLDNDMTSVGSISRAIKTHDMDMIKSRNLYYITAYRLCCNYYNHYKDWCDNEGLEQDPIIAKHIKELYS